MKLTVTDLGTYTLVAVDGVLDEGSKGAFDEYLHPLIDRGPQKLLVDLSHAERITSAGIGQLVTLVSRANTKGGRIVFVNPAPFVRSIFHVTKLNKFFEIEETTEAGVERLRSEAGS